MGLDLSYTGRFALFSCRDGRIVEPAVPDKTSHLFWVDRERDEYRLLNPTSGDHSAVFGASISGNGRVVIFSTTDADLSADDPSGPLVNQSDVFWRTFG